MFTYEIFQSDEDGGYIADIPGLPRCSAFGESPEQALYEVLKAKSAWLEAVKEAGKPIPPPSFEPANPVLPYSRSTQ